MDSIEERLEQVEAEIGAIHQILSMLVQSAAGAAGGDRPMSGPPGYGPRGFGPPGGFGPPAGFGPSGVVGPGVGAFDAVAEAGLAGDVEGREPAAVPGVPVAPEVLVAWIGQQNFVIADELRDPEPENRRVGWRHVADWVREHDLDLPSQVAAALLESLAAR